MTHQPHRRDRLNRISDAKTPVHNRRRFLQLGFVALAAASLPRPIFAASASGSRPERALAFFNTHTGERLKVTYWEQGQYVGEALSQIDHVLRDHLANETKEIAPKLLDLLCAMRSQLDSREPFHVISGMNTVGQAIDIRLPGRDLRTLRKVALDLKGGGVGFYPKSDFVHVDIGGVRYW